MNTKVNKYLNTHKATQSQIIEQNKRQIWEDIKTNMPEFAEFVLLINKEFGKPGRVSYEARKLQIN